MKFVDWGCIDYLQAWKKQEIIFHNIIGTKKEKKDTRDMDTLVFCEHPHVYTLGKSGNENNLLVSREFLEKTKATFYHIDRGGDITYHGPGQIVGYPILDLENHHLTLKAYVASLEEAIIKTLQNYGIISTRLPGATGVWLDADTTKARKICAIGVKASRFVTMHGFALNVNTDLEYFNYINPCGFVNKGVTSMQKELGNTLDMEEVKTLLKNNLLEIFR